MNYVVIDFETANSKPESACALGIIEVCDGNIINEKDFLIDPEDSFDYFNSHLHGITYKTIKGKPKFYEIWTEIKDILNNKFVIAHNASYDISVLRHVLDKYNLEYPTFSYSCTRILSKKTWPNLLNYKVDTVANNLNIEFKHHQECEDAKATSKIFETILQLNNTNDITKLHENLKVKIGSISPEGYTPAKVKRSHSNSSNHSSSHIKASDLIPETTEFDETHVFYNKGISFTGTLSIQRKDAAQLAVNKGAFYCSTVTKKTNFLVMGVQDYKKFVDGEKSSKLKKAEELIEKGQDLEIIDENEFFKLL